MSTRKWNLLFPKTKKTQRTTQEVIDVLLKNRGIKTAKDREEFLNTKLDSVTIEKVGIDIREIKKTIKRIKDSIAKNEKIIIYGDYDVDGICGTAILWETLFKIHKNVMPHIPHRVDEGYGLSIKGIDHVLTEHPDTKLIITVDNGIVALGATEYANKKGIDVIITDHHVAGEKLPSAYSIVHTTLLCGAGVALILSLAFEGVSHPEKNDPRLDLVALATVADLVPLTKTNRAFVKSGLEVLRNTNRAGLLALFEQVQIRKEEIDVYKIGHIIAPRLNASGRITHALDSLRLVCTKDLERAKKLAQGLGETNKARQAMTEESTSSADLITENVTSDQKFIFVSSKKYNQGIIGLVASRLVERHYRPTIVVSAGEEFSKGSARSVAGFNIIEFIRSFSHLLVDAGGHPMAAGFTVETHRIEELKVALIKSADKLIDEKILERVIDIDMEIPFSAVNSEFYNQIESLSPFGMANPQPLFLSTNVTVENMMMVGRDRKHLKMNLSQNGKSLEAILFRAEESKLRVGDVMDVVYVIDEDTWNGNRKIVLKIRDVKTVS